MIFIKITLSEKVEQIINVDNILQLIEGEDLQLIEVENKERFQSVPSYTLILKNCGPIKITEEVYKQIKEKIKDLIL